MSEFTRPRSESFDGAILVERIGRHADAISSCFVHAQSFILVFTVEHIMDDLRQAWVRAIVYPYWCSKKAFRKLEFSRQNVSHPTGRKHNMWRSRAIARTGARHLRSTHCGDRAQLRSRRAQLVPQPNGQERPPLAWANSSSRKHDAEWPCKCPASPR